jgi:hypothetical protein
MNSLIREEFPLHATQSERYELLEVLTDEDLAYKLPGDNPTFGELCREIGEVQYGYIQSFRTLKHDLSFRASDPQLGASVARLKEWYRSLDDEFESVMRGFSEEDLHERQIDRGQGFTPSLSVQFVIYREALLMFYAKASVYLKALGKTVNDRWHTGIG